MSLKPFGSLLIVALMLHFQILPAIHHYERPRIMYFSGLNYCKNLASEKF